MGRGGGGDDVCAPPGAEPGPSAARRLPHPRPGSALRRAPAGFCRASAYRGRRGGRHGEGRLRSAEPRRRRRGRARPLPAPVPPLPRPLPAPLRPSARSRSRAPAEGSAAADALPAEVGGCLRADPRLPIHPSLPPSCLRAMGDPRGAPKAPPPQPTGSSPPPPPRSSPTMGMGEGDPQATGTWVPRPCVGEMPPAPGGGGGGGSRGAHPNGDLPADLRSPLPGGGGRWE